jgi:N-acetylmuramoyl-L-alanine amidase CwlA
VIGVQRNAPATKLNVGPNELEPIIHNTSNPGVGADALMHATFVKNGGGSDNVSFHFANDSKRAVQILPLDRIAYHASDGCDSRADDEGCFWGIAIENCDNADGDIRKTFDNCAELIACIEFGDDRIDYGTMPKAYFKGFIDRALGHQDVAWDHKYCPEDFLNLYGDQWKPKMKALAKAKLAAKMGGTTPAEPPSTTYADAHPVEKGSRIINDHQFLAPGGKTFQRQTTPQEWGDKTAAATGPDIAKGTQITQAQISHYVQGTDGNLYLVLTGVPNVKDGSRVPADAVIAA